MGNDFRTLERVSYDHCLAMDFSINQSKEKKE